MSYNKVYIGAFVNAEVDPSDNSPLDIENIVRIYDTESGEAVEPTEVIELEMADTPVKAIVIDNDEDKFKVFRSKQYEIRIYSADGIGIETFLGGGDNRFYVEFETNEVIKFKGFLSVSDIQEDFLPDPNVITLTATDGLGFLSDEDLKNTDDEVPKNEHPIISYLIWALRKTGLDLPIWAIYNVRNETAQPIDKIGAAPFTVNATFTNPENNIIVSEADLVNFYVGQRLEITGTASNNQTVNVIGKATANILGITIGIVGTSGTFTDEESVSATFTDVTPSGHFFNHEYVDARSYEGSDPGSTIDCRSVLERILYGAYITQWNGTWLIVRVDELQYLDNCYLFKFGSDGIITSYEEINPVKYIQAGTIHSWMNDDAIAMAETAHKEVRLSFKYQNPAELVCNIDIERGEGDEPTGAESETIDYTPECIEYLREGSPSDGNNLDQPAESGSVGVIRKVFEYGYEKDRYLVSQSAGGFKHYFKFTPIKVVRGDKIAINLAYRFDSDESTTNVTPLHVRLVANDGTIYDWDYTAATATSAWVEKTLADAVFTTNWTDNITGLDDREWKTVSGTSLPMPKQGKLYIRMLNGFSSRVQYFSSFSVEYIPILNGSYRKYTGHRHTVAQAGNTKALREAEVFMSDAPNTLIKGAILKADLENPGEYVLAGDFYSAAVLPDGPGSQENIHPFGEIQAFDVWNQYNRTMIKFQGTVDGLDSSGTMPDLVHKYIVGDANENTGERTFMALHFEQSYHECEMGIMLHEVHNPNIAKQYLGHSFKYLTGNE